MEKKRASVWKKEITDILASKVNEFHLLGYDKATKDSIWDCMKTEVWKGDPKLFLFEIIADIFRLKPNVYMNYLTKATYVEDQDLMKSIAAVTKSETTD